MKKLTRISILTGLLALFTFSGCGRLINNLCIWRNDDYHEALPREKIQLKMLGDFTSEGYVFKPFYSYNRYPAVVMAHTLGGSKDDQTNLLARRIAKKGFLTITFDIDGHGSNEYPFDVKTTIYNISKAIDYLYTRPDVDRNNIYVVGANLGAVLGIKSGVIDWRIKGVVAISALYNLDINVFKFIAEANIFHIFDPTEVRFAEDQGSLVARINRQLDSLDIINNIGKLSPHPLLLIHAEKDGLISRDQAQTLYDNAGDPRELMIVPGEKYHTLLLNKGMTDHIVRWLKTQCEKS